MLTKDFEELLNVGIALSSVHDLDKLLDMILSEAQKLTFADSGSIYLVEGDKLVFKASRSNTYFKKLGEEKTRAIFKSFEIPITKQSISGYVALTSKILNIPDVQNIPDDSEFQYNSTLDKKYGYKTISMLVIPMVDHDNRTIGVLQLINSIDDGKIVPFTKEHQKITASFSSQAAVAIQNTKLTQDLKSAHIDTIFRLSAAAEFRDKETGNHIKRVSYYSKVIAENIGLSQNDAELIFWSAPMHDIGKIGISDAILQKPGKLTPEERAIMEQHSIIGAMVLKGASASVLKKSRIVALTHHERVDGMGYPLKLSGDEIPIEGKIVALADVYDALSSKRCYKEPFCEDKIMGILNDERGKHFDTKVLDTFLAHYKEIKDIKQKYSDTEESISGVADGKNINMWELLK